MGQELTEVVRDHHGDLVGSGLDPEKSGLLVHRSLLFRMPRERAVVQHRLADRLEGQLEIRVHRELVKPLQGKIVHSEKCA